MKNASKIRKFNQYYALILGVFENKVFDSKYSLTELRVVGEVGRHKGVKAQAIAKFLHMDRSYLSRIIKKFEREHIIFRRPSLTDQRSWELELTEAGYELYEYAEKKSDDKILAILEKLSTEEILLLEDAMETIENVLSQVLTNKIEGV